MAAVRELLSTMGQGEIRISMIVQHAGVARGTFYLHFPDAPAILRSVALEFLDGLDEELRSLGDEASAYALIEAVMRSYLTYVLNRRDVARATFELNDLDPEVGSAFSALLSKWAARTEKTIERWGGLVAPAGSVRSRCFMLLCMMEGFLQRAMGSADPDAGRLIADPEAVIRELSVIWYQSMFASPAPF